MMRGVSTWAVAVRKPLPEQIADGRELQVGEAAEGEIDVQSFPLVSWAKRHRVLRWPVIRGVVALAESLNIGFKALNISANAQLPEDEEEISGAMWAGLPRTCPVDVTPCASSSFAIPKSVSLIATRSPLGVLIGELDGIPRRESGSCSSRFSPRSRNCPGSSAARSRSAWSPIA